jgi:tRNA (guanine-N7-)-methyltransferase
MIKNPDSLFITRRRKKWKFAHFDDWANCFSRDEVTPEFWATYFVPDMSLNVEVGAGTADLSVGLARVSPEQAFVALDVKSDRLYTGAKTALQEGLPNLAFVRAHANDLPKFFKPRTVQTFWITFPDPFPRKRQAKHRLTHPHFLKQYEALLQPGGEIHFKTDNRALFLWSLEQIVANGWQIEALSFDLHDSDLPQFTKITTAYERRFMAEGIPINYCRMTFGNPS